MNTNDLVIYEDDCMIVSINIDELHSGEIIQKLIDWYVEFKSFSGESIYQMDDPQIYAPLLLSELADEHFKFHIEYKD